MKIIYLMGGTCCGKSSVLSMAREFYKERAGFVEVGKALRSKYPPDYFKGLAAPEHLEKEAINLYVEGVSACLADKREYCWVDGQPRSPFQVDAVLGTFSTIPKQFLLFTASADEQAKRAAKRFAKDLESLKLAIARIDNDRKQGYDTLVRLLDFGRRVDVFGSENLQYPPEFVFEWVKRVVESITYNLIYLPNA
jgi:hypothetical protein